MKIEDVVQNMEIPARTVTAPARVSALKQKMDALEIGSGITYVLEGKDKDGVAKKPEVRNQYVHVSKDFWEPKGKTFKVFVSKNQEGLGENETRFSIVRVEFEARKPRQTAVQAADQASQNAGVATENDGVATE